MNYVKTVAQTALAWRSPEEPEGKTKVSNRDDGPISALESLRQENQGSSLSLAAYQVGGQTKVHKTLSQTNGKKKPPNLALLPSET